MYSYKGHHGPRIRHIFAAFLEIIVIFFLESILPFINIIVYLCCISTCKLAGTYSPIKSAQKFATIYLIWT